MTYLVRETMARVPSYVDGAALHSAGNLALVAASRAYDLDRGVPFDRYASTRIRGALVDELRSTDWATRSLRRRSRDLALSLGHTPSDAEVAQELGMTLEPSADFSYADTLRETGAGPEGSALDRERLEHVADAVAELPDRLATVVRGYFLQERPMAEIAAELGVSESRISQLRAEALVLLRDALEGSPEARPSGVVGRRRAAYANAVAERNSRRHAQGRVLVTA